MNLREECKNISDLFCDTVTAYTKAVNEAVAGMSEERRIEYFIGEIASCNSSWSGGPYGPGNIDEYIRRAVCIDLLKRAHHDQRRRAGYMAGKDRFILLKKFADGHRFYIDRTNGRIAVADNSGTYPDSTDDGVMWLDFERSPNVDAGDFNGFPVEKASGERLSICAVKDESAWLRSLFTGKGV